MKPAAARRADVANGRTTRALYRRHSSRCLRRSPSRAGGRISPAHGGRVHERRPAVLITSVDDRASLEQDANRGERHPAARAELRECRAPATRRRLERGGVDVGAAAHEFPRDRLMVLARCVVEGRAAK